MEAVNVHTRLSPHGKLGRALLERAGYHGSPSRAATAALRRYLALVDAGLEEARKALGSEEAVEEAVERLAEELRRLPDAEALALPQDLPLLARVALLDLAERRIGAGKGEGQ